MKQILLVLLFAGALRAAEVNGYVDLAQMTAPSAPASNFSRLYISSVSKQLVCTNSDSSSCLPASGIVTVTTGSGAPSGSCTSPSSTNLAYYFDTTNLNLWYCSATNTWQELLTAAAGQFLLTGQEGSKPSSPASGFDTLYLDSTSHVLGVVQSSGAVSQTVVGLASSTSHEWVQYINQGGVQQLTQPACADISNAGTVCTLNTGTSGGTVPLLNGNNTYSGTSTFTGTFTASSTVTFGTITGSTQCLQVNSSGVVSGFGGACGGSGSLAFSSIIGGTNTTAAMVVGVGASLTINQSSAAVPTIPTNSNYTIVGASATNSRVVNVAYGATPFFTAYRIDGTPASPTAVVSADQLGGVNAWAYDGTTDGGPLASFRTFANQNFTSTAHGTYADITTTPNGTTTAVQVIQFGADGGITVPGIVTGGDQGVGTVNAGGLFVNGTAVQLQGTAVSATTLSASSTVSGTGFSNYLASPPAIGGTTPAAGSFTTLSATGNLTTNVTGSSQCLQVNSSGVVSGSGGACGGSGGSASLTVANTFTTNGAASTPSQLFNGTWFTSGTATTTKPFINIETSGATSTAWSTSGTGLGINAASGFAGNLVDFQKNGTSEFSVSSTGVVVANSTIEAGFNLVALNNVQAPDFRTTGTKFTASGCSNSTTVGGATGGSFKLGTNSCSVTVTMGSSVAAPNGWSCWASDQTTALGNPVYPSGGSTTTAIFTFNATAASSDVINWGCIAY